MGLLVGYPFGPSEGAQVCCAGAASGDGRVRVAILFRGCCSQAVLTLRTLVLPNWY